MPHILRCGEWDRCRSAMLISPNLGFNLATPGGWLFCLAVSLLVLLACCFIPYPCIVLSPFRLSPILLLFVNHLCCVHLCPVLLWCFSFVSFVTIFWSAFFAYVFACYVWLCMLFLSFRWHDSQVAVPHCVYASSWKCSLL